MVTELSGVQFGLKSYAWFQNINLKSQVWFQTKIAWHKVQLFWNHGIQSVSIYFIDRVAGLSKSGNKKAFTSNFVLKKVVQYRAKVVGFKTEMMPIRTWMRQFRADLI